MKLFRKTPKDPERPLVVPNAAGDSAETFAEPMVDGVRQLMNRLMRQGELPDCIAVVAGLRGEGVTTVSRALGATLAHDLGAKVCIVELNSWWPTQNEFMPNGNGGMAAVVWDDAELNDIICTTGWENLDTVSVGEIAPDKRPVFAHSPQLQQSIQTLRETYDYVILDVPALLATNDAVSLASLASACCVVIRQGATRMESVKRALDEVSHLNLLGVVLNQTRLATPSFLLRLFPQ